MKGVWTFEEIFGFFRDVRARVMFLGLHGRVDLSEEDVAFSQIPGQGARSDERPLCVLCRHPNSNPAGTFCRAPSALIG